MASITNVDLNQEVIFLAPKEKRAKTAHSHAIYNAHLKFDGHTDTYTCTNPKDVKKWLACAKKNGQCGDITYYPKEKRFILKDVPAKFGYKVKPGETAQMVMAKFNLKPHALEKYDNFLFRLDNPYITQRDAKKGVEKIIYFAEEDILP